MSYRDKHTGKIVQLARSDMQLKEGYYFKYSDDLAKTWSKERFLIPVRRTSIDHTNPWDGIIMGMFMCDIPQRIGSHVVFAFQKTIDGAGETPRSEAFFLRSPNLLSCNDFSQVIWETLPVGSHGLRPPLGAPLALAEEPHVLQVYLPLTHCDRQLSFISFLPPVLPYFLSSFLCSFLSFFPLLLLLLLVLLRPSLLCSSLSRLMIQRRFSSTSTF